MYSIRNNASKPKKRLPKKSLIGGGILIVLALIIAALEITNVTHFFHDKPLKGYETQANKPSRTITDSKGETANQTDQNTVTSPAAGNTANEQPGDSKQNNVSPGISGELMTPTGSFVGNHRPENASMTIQSVCNTSPGATCQIVFKKGSEAKTLPAQLTDRGGASYWTWTTGQIGLSAGTWSVSATATAGNQSKSATDSISLEVQ